MNTENLLHAARPTYVLIPRPGQSETNDQKYWSMRLDGLDQNHIKASAKELRKARMRPGHDDPALKLTPLYQGLAHALGGTSFDAWRNTEQDLHTFLVDNGMTKPVDLISWSRAPSRLTARQVSDRLFNSGLPLPQRIFTGVGSKFYTAHGVGRADLDLLSKFTTSDDMARFEWCQSREKQVVLSPQKDSFWEDSAPEFVDLTGRDLLLHTFRLELAGAFNLLGSNLIAPMEAQTEFRVYNANEDELAFDQRIFDTFREEIERSESGWVEVIPFPGNDNIVFLKGANGTFDWVIRDQRDEAFSGNPYHPILMSHDLPTAMKVSGLEAHLYFKTGEWYERLEHDAETRHYAEGGSVATWPGYSKLLMRELLATRQNYAPPSQPKGWGSEEFIPHRLDGYCLMVSPPVTIQDFWRFYKNADWHKDRVSRSERTSNPLEVDLAAVNLHDDDHLPASVTWFDAVAFCRYYETQTGLPVRLLEVDEWKQIAPTPSRDIKKEGWGDLTWVVVGGDGKTGGETSHRYPEACAGSGFLRFGKELTWAQNSQGLPFLSVVDFGEWLADYAYGHAPVGNAATGYALMTGPIDRDRCPAHLSMRYKGLKVGFRLCYVAHFDA